MITKEQLLDRAACVIVLTLYADRIRDTESKDKTRGRREFLLPVVGAEDSQWVALPTVLIAEDYAPREYYMKLWLSVSELRFRGVAVEYMLDSGLAEIAEDCFNW